MPVGEAESRSRVGGGAGTKPRRARHASHARVAPIDSMRPLTATRTLLALERRFRRPRQAVIPAVVLVGVLAVLAPLSSAGLLWLLKVMIDSVFVARRLDAMPILIAGYFGLASLKFGADYLRRCMDVAVAERINQDVRAEVYRHVMTLSEPSVIGRGIGDLLAHLSGDVERVEYLIFAGPIMLISDVAAATFFTVVLFMMNWQLALVAFTAAPFLAWVVVRRAPRVKRTARVARRQAASWLALAEETLGALPMLHAFRAHDHETARFNARMDVSRRAEIRNVAVQAQLTLLVEMIALVGGLVVLVLAAHHVSSRVMTLGAVVALLRSTGAPGRWPRGGRTWGCRPRPRASGGARSGTTCARPGRAPPTPTSLARSRRPEPRRLSTPAAGNRRRGSAHAVNACRAVSASAWLWLACSCATRRFW